MIVSSWADIMLDYISTRHQPTKSCTILVICYVSSYKISFDLLLTKVVDVEWMPDGAKNTKKVCFDRKFIACFTFILLGVKMNEARKIA